MRKLLALFLSLVSMSLLATEPEAVQPVKRLLDPSTDAFIGLTPYRQNYLMETYSNGNFTQSKDMRHDEVKFQISLALPIWRNILGHNSVLAGSYTQQSWFQLTNTKHSSPFRESNYQPQLFLAWSTAYELPFNWTLNEIETGFMHHSNGRSDENKHSRSWNRLYARFAATHQNWLVEIKPYWRIPEKAKDDDNPDIVKFYGFADFSLGYHLQKHQFKVTARYNPSSNKGGIEASWSYPLTDNIRLYTQYYHGYGESLIDYNRNIKRLGIGISLNNVF